MTGAGPLVFVDHVGLPFKVGFSRVQRAFAEYGLDERLVFSILLGFHLVSFSSPIGTQHRLGAPQGVEVVWRDALGRRNNASVGGFFYPPINGKTYYNSWLRIGGPSVFGEINYLYWTELSGDGGHASSRSLGISIGAPLFFL